MPLQNPNLSVTKDNQINGYAQNQYCYDLKNSYCKSQ